MDIKSFIIENWKSAEMLKTLIGTPFERGDEFHWGEIPTNQAYIEVENGKITRIQTWSGLGWSAKYGYGSPTVDVS
ncbi:MAG: hypothetical protein ACKPEQ_04090 [Dolichospermum sp.]